MMRTLTGLAVAAAVSGCNGHGDPGYQGWVEADMIFISPDEFGRVTKLNVREGDEVNAVERLFTAPEAFDL